MEEQQLKITPALLEQLKQALESNTSLLKTAQKMMGAEEEEERSRKLPPFEVKDHKEIVKKVRCLHCGHEWEKTVTLTPKSGTFSYSRNGKTIYIKYDAVETGQVVMVGTNSCGSCADFIASLPREALERRYLRLLGRQSIPPRPPLPSTEELLRGVKDED